MRFLFAFLLTATSFIAFSQADVQKKLQRQLIMAEDGATITIDAGTFSILGSLSLEGKKNITLRGAGMDKTILSFKGQTDGAEGLRVSNAENIILENFTVQDAKGDAIKTMNVERNYVPKHESRMDRRAQSYQWRLRIVSGYVYECID